MLHPRILPVYYVRVLYVLLSAVVLAFVTRYDVVYACEPASMVMMRPIQ